MQGKSFAFSVFSGISNSRISISFSHEGDDIIITCGLAGNESLTQVNWEMVQSSNHTKIGIFHPDQGIYIFPEHSGKVKIQGKRTPQATSDLSLRNEALNESGLICCQFITFPSGSLKQCANISNAVMKSIRFLHSFYLICETLLSLHIAIHNEYLQFPMCMCVYVYTNNFLGVHMSSAEPHGTGQKQGLFGKFGALIVGCILSLSFLTIPIYICQRCFCRRYNYILQIKHIFRWLLPNLYLYMAHICNIQIICLLSLLCKHSFPRSQVLPIQHVYTVPSAFTEVRLNLELKIYQHYISAKLSCCILHILFYNNCIQNHYSEIITCFKVHFLTDLRWNNLY